MPIVTILLTMNTMVAAAQQRPSQAPSVVVTSHGYGLPSARHDGAQARLMAQRAAEVNAYRNLLQAPAKRTIPKSCGTYRIHTTGRVRGFKTVSTIQRRDGTVEVTIAGPASTATPATVHSTTRIIVYRR